MKMWPAFLLLLAGLAGCVDPGTGPTGSSSPTCAATSFEDPAIRLVNATVDPIVDERELQWQFNTTNIRTCALSAIGHTPLRWAADGTPQPHGYIGEIDMRGDLDLGAVAVLGAGGETPTAYILDISDRRAPQVLSTIEMPGTYMVDIKISDDGGRLFIASQTTPSAGELYGLPALAPYGPTGFTVYDISDPAAPEHVIHIPDSQVGCHMLSHEIVGTTHVVACISQQVRLHAFDTTGGQFAYIGFVDYVPSTGAMGTPGPSALPAAGDPTCTNPQDALPTAPCLLGSGPHDMIIQRDPVTDDLLMVVSHWNEGMRVVDLNDAPQATELGSWTGQGATHYDGNVHTAMMFYANGTRYIMASPEYTYSGQVPSLWLLDATDLTAPRLVGEWYHPNEHQSQGLYLTTHQWQVAPTGPDVPIEDVRVYLTMNHGGVWVIGLEEMIKGDLWGAIKGFHLSRTPLDPDTAITQNAVYNTWDINVVDGYIYGSDRATGLWVFHYEEDELGDAGRTGFA